MKIFAYLALIFYISTITILGARLNVINNVHNTEMDELKQAHEEEIAEYEQTIQYLKNDIESLEGGASSFWFYRVKLTYYAPSKRGINSDGNPKVTATGGKPIPGRTIAVSRDLKHLLHKKVFVPGKGIFYANDLMARRNPYTGKPIKKQIDICVRRVKDIPKQGVFKNVPIAVKI